jgi:FKBP-type peptidyl-prolyl cis-trans isomerase
LRISEKSSNFAADISMNTNLLNRTMVRLGALLLLLSGLLGCNKSPQPVKFLGEDKEPDSLMLAQMRFNQQMVNAASVQCLAYVQGDKEKQYVQDEAGFWYTKVMKTDLDSLRQGEQVDMHIQIYELNDSLVADVKESFQMGQASLPMAILRSLKMMKHGEQMQIVTPWYAAYGVEGTTLINPYSNLKIVVSVGE